MIKFGTGFPDIDQHLTADRPQFVILGARPGVGKTTLGIQITNHLLTQGARIRYYSLEMTAAELLPRLDANQAGTLFIDDNPILVFGRLKADVEKAAALNKPYDMLVIDYLQLLTLTTNRPRNIQIATVLEEFKHLALAMNVNVLLLSQLNRVLPTTFDIKPHALREGLPQDADIVFLLQADQATVKLDLAKNRTSATTAIHLEMTADRIFKQCSAPPLVDQQQAALVKFHAEINSILSEVLTDHGIEKWWHTKNPHLTHTPVIALTENQQPQIMKAAKLFTEAFYV